MGVGCGLCGAGGGEGRVARVCGVWAWGPDLGFCGLYVLVRAPEVVCSQADSLLYVPPPTDDVCIVEICMNLVVAVKLF